MKKGFANNMSNVIIWCAPIIGILERIKRFLKLLILKPRCLDQIL